MTYQFQPGSEMIKPLRQTYKYMSGLKVKRPTTYDEATYNLQPYENFHYRPIWNPDIQIYDENITKLVCTDWEQFRDPARLYYATYCYDRAELQTRIKGQFNACERLGVFRTMDDSFVRTVSEFFPVLRHLFFGESVVYMYVGRFSVGTAIEQCATYQSFDLLGSAQLITKICAELESRNPAILSAGKQKWLEDEKFQPLRALTEKLMVTWDWGEAVVAVNLLLNLIVYPLFFEEMSESALENGGAGYAMFSEFFWHMFDYERNWAAALMKMLIADTPANQAVIQSFVDEWLPQVIAAIKPILPIFAMPGQAKDGEVVLQNVLDKHVRPVLETELGLIMPPLSGELHVTEV
ncbi:hypothetical protein [Aneurinibacillus uraniidurans]|uniref:hypothetical protein n=1 Tax=Aneurinibacillus uraniidurans TaxID=2966586 RepID=UPI00234A28AB|nr:hypothetical protein [Aneurinibacillus sp. B1]WCN39501.1 hypothetical protein PO771_08940 [Aneurinibacillus sp. B1]